MDNTEQGSGMVFEETSNRFVDAALGLLPKQALRAIQCYNFLIGNRFLMSTIGIQAVCSDLTAPPPFLKHGLNGSLFCLGARVVSGRIPVQGTYINRGRDERIVTITT